MSLPFAKTTPARRNARSGPRPIKSVDFPMGLFALSPERITAGVYGCYSPDGMFHATYVLRHEWMVAREMLSGVPA